MIYHIIHNNYYLMNNKQLNNRLKLGKELLPVPIYIIKTHELNEIRNMPKFVSMLSKTITNKNIAMTDSHGFNLLYYVIIKKFTMLLSIVYDISVENNIFLPDNVINKDIYYNNEYISFPMYILKTYKSHEVNDNKAFNDIMKRLINYKNIYLVDSLGNNLLYYAITNGFTNLIDDIYLIESDFTINNYGDNALMTYIRYSKNMSNYKFLVNHSSTRQVNIDGDTALKLAIKYTKPISLLMNEVSITSDILLYILYKYDDSAYMKIILHKVIDYLITKSNKKRNMYINYTDVLGNNPLMMYIQKVDDINLTTLHYLCSDISTSQVNNRYDSALSIAIHMNCSDHIIKILKNDKVLYMHNYNGDIPAVMAIKLNRDISVIRHLINYKIIKEMDNVYIVMNKYRNFDALCDLFNSHLYVK